MPTPRNNTNAFIDKLKTIGLDITFKSDASFYWSPRTRTIHYNHNALTHKEGLWSLLHETAHASLNHKHYHSDLELLQMEAEAWERAQTLAQSFGLCIDDSHIQDCLDTYRDWLHQRSTCPRCGVVCFQTSASEYTCHNCVHTWSVSTSRFCRPYRLSSNFKPTEKAVEKLSPTTFS